jgi:2-polyprenyl-3-methyl-5-hydroxy-6-metoxy-1,4-benzoquinol methylase
MSNYSDSAFKDDPNSSWHKTLKLVPAKSKVLDIGCSSGTFGNELIKKKMCVVDGIEINDGDIAQAKKRLRKVHKINVETDPITVGEAYDIIFLGDVIEHLARPVQTLKRLKKLLKKDGRLIFSIPNITHMSVRLMLMSGKIEYGRTGLLDETHLHFYNREEIYRVLNEAGYKIEVFDYTVNDVPLNLAKRKLAELGLAPKKEFKKLLESTNGAAYQFIGVASKTAGSTKQKLPKSSPDNIVGAYIDELKADYDKVIKDLQGNLKKTAEDRQRIIADRDRIQTELEQTLTHRARKLARKVRAKTGRK